MHLAAGGALSSSGAGRVPALRARSLCRPGWQLGAGRRRRGPGARFRGAQRECRRVSDPRRRACCGSCGWPCRCRSCACPPIGPTPQALRGSPRHSLHWGQPARPGGTHHTRTGAPLLGRAPLAASGRLPVGSTPQPFLARKTRKRYCIGIEEIGHDTSSCDAPP